MIYCDTVETFK